MALAAWLLAANAQAHPDGDVSFRLVSVGTRIDGTVTSKSNRLHGHIIDNGRDFTLDGVVGSHSVTVKIYGKIVPQCLTGTQSASGTGVNYGEDTSVDLTVICANKSFNSESYTFHL